MAVENRLGPRGLRLLPAHPPWLALDVARRPKACATAFLMAIGAAVLLLARELTPESRRLSGA